VVDASGLSKGDIIAIGDDKNLTITDIAGNVITVDRSITTVAGDNVYNNFLGYVTDTVLDDAALKSALVAKGLDVLSVNESTSFSVDYVAPATTPVGPLSNTVTVYYEPDGYFPNNIIASASHSLTVVDAKVEISPQQATNGVGTTHVLPVKVSTAG